MSAASLFVVGVGVVLALPIIARIRWRRFDPFEPIVLFALAYGTMFVARPAYMLLSGSLSYGGVDLRQTFPVACGLALLGATAFVSGYEASAGLTVIRHLPAPREISVRGAVICASLLAAISLVLLLVVLAPLEGTSQLRLLLEGRSKESPEWSTDSSYVWYGLRLVVPAAICLFALTLRRRRISLLALTVTATTLSLVVTVPLGARGFLLPLLGAFFVLPFLRRDRRPGPLVLTLVLVTAILLSFVFGVIRDPARRSNPGAEVTSVLHQPQTLLDPILVGNDAEMAPVLAAALTVVPEELGYRYGKVTLADVAVRPIPREFWSGKPIPPDEEIVAAVWPGLVGLFHPVYTPLIFFYWDFGIAGVLVGMMILGVVFRMLYEWFSAHRNSLGAQLIFAAAIWFVVIAIRDHPAEALSLATFVIGPLVLLERLSGRQIDVFTSRRMPAEPQR